MIAVGDDELIEIKKGDAIVVRRAPVVARRFVVVVNPF
jgi:hypothetical protein